MSQGQLDSAEVRHCGCFPVRLAARHHAQLCLGRHSNGTATPSSRTGGCGHGGTICSRTRGRRAAGEEALSKRGQARLDPDLPVRGRTQRNPLQRKRRFPGSGTRSDGFNHRTVAGRRFGRIKESQYHRPNQRSGRNVYSFEEHSDPVLDRDPVSQSHSPRLNPGRVG